MNIKDEDWQALVKEARVISRYIYSSERKKYKNIPHIEDQLEADIFRLLDRFLLLQNYIPPPKTIYLSSINSVPDSKLFIFKWSLKQLFKRKSRNCRKSR